MSKEIARLKFGWKKHQQVSEISFQSNSEYPIPIKWLLAIFQKYPNGPAVKSYGEDWFIIISIPIHCEFRVKFAAPHLLERP